jgi:hypothetical protein
MNRSGLVLVDFGRVFVQVIAFERFTNQERGLEVYHFGRDIS